MLRKVFFMVVCKINMDIDLRLVMIVVIRKFLVENLKEFDLRKYIGVGRDVI